MALTRELSVPRYRDKNFFNLKTLNRDLGGSSAMVALGCRSMIPGAASQTALNPVLSPFFAESETLSLRSCKLPTPNTVEIDVVEGTASRRGRTAILTPLGLAQVGVPSFADSLISVGLLKQLAGRADATFLMKKGHEWHIVSDDHIIDMTDDTVTYKMGSIEIQS